jgi:hypothetical protein
VAKARGQDSHDSAQMSALVCAELTGCVESCESRWRYTAIISRNTSGRRAAIASSERASRVLWQIIAATGPCVRLGDDRDGAGHKRLNVGVSIANSQTIRLRRIYVKDVGRGLVRSSGPELPGFSLEIRRNP